jgi:hypothetical protein
MERTGRIRRTSATIDQADLQQTVTLNRKTGNHSPIVHISDDEVRAIREMKAKRRERFAGQTNSRDFDTGEQPIPQRITKQQAKVLVYDIDREIETDRLEEQKSEKSDFWYRILKFGSIGAAIMLIIIILCYSQLKNAVVIYNQQMYGRWEVTHYDGFFGLPNETKDLPTHIIAINDSGTFVIIIDAPFQPPQKWTVPQYGFDKGDTAQFTPVTINGVKGVEIQVESSAWFLMSNGKTLVPQQLPSSSTK